MLKGTSEDLGNSSMEEGRSGEEKKSFKHSSQKSLRKRKNSIFLNSRIS